MTDAVTDWLTLEANARSQETRAALATLLRRVFPARGLVLELGSGNGEHVVYLAGRLPRLRWQPSDVDPARRAVIERWIATTSADNVLPPLALDVTEAVWPIENADAVLACNLLQAAPADAMDGVMRGVARCLAPGAPFVLCGTFLCGGDSPAVLDYDTRLREHDPAWGVRRLDAVLRAARAHGLRLEDARELPADHLALVLERGSQP